MTQTIKYATPQAVEPSRRGRGFLAVALSMLLPGLGHLAAGARQRAIGWFSAWVGLTLATFTAMSFYQTVPALLVLIPLGVLFELALWVDAYRTAHRRQLPRPAAPVVRYGLGLLVFGVGLFAHPLFVIFQYWKLPTVEALVVPGLTMQPTIADGDRVLNHKLLEPQRWDIAVYYAPIDLGQHLFVGRVVGLPGDTLTMKDGALHINGERATPPVHVQGVTLEVSHPRYRISDEFNLGDNEYFVLGDNSAVAHDSRYFGPVKRDALRGRATWIYWPISRMGRIE